ncbi:flagellar basal-body MS-ring/collar protein FliF [Pantoea eucrina]|uniref:Flagellar M-ring protein n=1 Tax=Pantoea eucrina TaxID=472693 RepID=A0ABU5LC84_9GAMM|nr:flagellar basal-body MS-ring/collar protein FliF [Pantoea eucrina]MDZ7277326.1 flagellar basal-body MS-ring/collar protein FliF [Pantoea eucrina]
MLKKLTSRLPETATAAITRWLLPGAIAMGITAVVVALLWQSNNRWTALFGSQENLPMADVVAALSDAGMRYRVAPDSGMVLVRESDLPKARLAMASKGIKALSPEGYGLMDKEEMLGSSQFVQNIRLRRSMEGELAQSIMALESVAYARVHLGITETSAFVLANKPNSTASVMLRLKHGRHLNDEQVGAIVSLVAGSVPGMQPERVSVVDQQGTLLSANVAAAHAGRDQRQGREQLQQMREAVERNLAHLLLPIVGRENFRVSVVPHVDFSQIEETQERYLNQPHVTREQLAQDNSNEPQAMGIPGSLSNRPVTPAAAKEAATALSTRSQSQREYQWDRDVRHIQHAGFAVQKLTVAVLLNENAEGVKTWSEAQRAQMNALLSKAAGIDSQRGDALSLALMSFNPPEVAAEETLSWWEGPSTLLWAERGGIGLLALLVTLFGVLPMMRRVGQSPQVQTPPTPEPEHDAKSEDAPLLPNSGFSNDDLPPQGSGLETKINYLQTLAQSETDRVADVLKQWVSSNERSSSK